MAWSPIVEKKKIKILYLFWLLFTDLYGKHHDPRESVKENS